MSIASKRQKTKEKIHYAVSQPAFLSRQVPVETKSIIVIQKGKKFVYVREASPI